MEQYTVTVIGLGFVGLTTALGLAEAGHRVYGVEKEPARLAQIQAGQLPFAEPNLDKALVRHLANGSFQATNNALTAATASQIIFLCVGTPCGDDGAADLQYLRQAIDDTLAAFTDGQYRLYVVKSTVPPGTTKRAIAPYLAEHQTPAMQIDLVNNPEFLREGYCWQDFIQADRIVCGCEDEEAEKIMRALYAPLAIPFHSVSLNTGEYIKYLSNSMLAAMISFANEMALLGEAIGDIEIARAFRILHEDRRWADGSMKSYVYPGCGYGGYCLPKDTKALQAQAKIYHAETKILDQVIALNEQMADKVAKRIMAQTKATDRIGILGLSFKPNSDDVRDTPAAKVIALLQENGYQEIMVYDPAANGLFAEKYPQLKVSYYSNAEDVCHDADIVVILTAWSEFREIRDKIRRKPFIDGRYLL